MDIHDLVRDDEVATFPRPAAASFLSDQESLQSASVPLEKEAVLSSSDQMGQGHHDADKNHCVFYVLHHH